MLLARDTEPEEHDVHVLLPALLYVLAAQLVQLVPPVLPKLPALQRVQMLAEVCVE